MQCALQQLQAQGNIPQMIMTGGQCGVSQTFLVLECFFSFRYY